MKRALADILWEAANEYLAPEAWGDEGYTYSCEAVAVAYRGDAALDGGWGASLASKPLKFLQSLGCPIHNGNGKGLFVKDTQGVRYMWLLLAAKVAEDEKIYVEVA